MTELPYMKIEIASLLFQKLQEMRVRLAFDDYFYREGIDPKTWKTKATYLPYIHTMKLGRGCSDRGVITSINHEFIHHIVSFLISIEASGKLDAFYAYSKDFKGLRKMFQIDENGVF